MTHPNYKNTNPANMSLSKIRLLLCPQWLWKPQDEMNDCSNNSLTEGGALIIDPDTGGLDQQRQLTPVSITDKAHNFAILLSNLLWIENELRSAIFRDKTA